MGLWSKFEGGKTVLVKDVVEMTGADEIMIGMLNNLAHPILQEA